MSENILDKNDTHFQNVNITFRYNTKKVHLKALTHKASIYWRNRYEYCRMR